MNNNINQEGGTLVDENELDNQIDSSPILEQQSDLSGCIEGEEVELWGQCYNIETTTILDLSNKGLTGEIPGNIVNLVNLKFLDISNNQLTGEIPYDICYMVDLGQLLMDNNKLCPTYPDCISDEEIGNQDQIDCLSVDNNDIDQGDVTPQLDEDKQPSTRPDIPMGRLETDELEVMDQEMLQQPIEQPIEQPPRPTAPTTRKKEIQRCDPGFSRAADGTCIPG